MFSSYVTRYGSQQQVWSVSQPLTTPRIHSAVAALNGGVYVMGGRSQVRRAAAVANLLIFARTLESWLVLAHKLCALRHCRTSPVDGAPSGCPNDCRSITGTLVVAFTGEA